MIYVSTNIILDSGLQSELFGLRDYSAQMNPQYSSCITIPARPFAATYIADVRVIVSNQ